MATNVGLSLLLRHRVEQGTEHVIVPIFNQHEARVVRVRVRLSGRVHLLNVVAILGCLKDELWDANAYIGRYREPELSIGVVIYYCRL